MDILLILALLFLFLADCYDFFHPFYMEKLEPHVEEDLLDLRVNIFSSGFDVVILYAQRVFYILILRVNFMQKSYEGPDDLVEKMKSLSVTHECFPAGEHCW